MGQLCKTTAGKVALGVAVLAAAGAAYAWHKQHQDDDDHATGQTTPTTTDGNTLVHAMPVGNPVLLSDLPPAASATPSEGSSPISWLPPELLIGNADTAIIRIDDPVRPQLWTM